ncbi:GAF and ANTAR domain-containing protein [Actinoplanes xinjiangensis]|uniref:GAF domain-containing protein n=1 Tax=Actinoplanes xinjiangensis TaxID=512350 RepID=A0A316ECZ5_9ACTN|nr:GAF and ANTAR domain-containing protein [Actinoplanes xinjiangensis]PWK27499.1 GAF domain-containing protein [Actinoplanes xinjiangensis]GIF45279.1 transcriptional regulator [Actinoplanes xinjiangensis]
MITVSVQKLATIFVEIADTLVDEFDVLDYMHMITERVAYLTEAPAVGMLLADQHSRLEFVAGSNENVTLVELFVVQNEEGPCLEAFRTGEPVVNVDLNNAAGRWPRFAPLAVATGFRSVHAFPMRLRRQVIGTLNVFGDVAGREFESDDVTIMQALADAATIGLLQERAIRHGETLTEQLQGALNSRIIIEQAKGAVAQAHGISVDDAFTVIRGYARKHNRRLTEVANALVTDPHSLQQLFT